MKQKPKQMQINVTEILSKVRGCDITNESAATLWLIAIISGLDETVIDISDLEIQKLGQHKILIRDGNEVIVDLEELNYNFEEIDNKIKEYRNVFKGLFTGSMGSPEACKTKLERWLLNNKKYTMEDVIKAAKYWVESKQREVNNPNLIGQADFFIYKKDGRGKDEQSRLSSIIEEALESDGLYLEDEMGVEL